MQLEKPDFTDLLYLLADNFKARVSGLQFTVNPGLGKGYFYAEKLACGITVLVSDTCLKEDVTVNLYEESERVFLLQFNEEAADETEIAVKTKRTITEFHSSVKLSHAISSETFIFPAGKRLRSVKFFFSEKHLSPVLTKEVFGKLLNYFSVEMRSESVEPIAIEYRVMLDDLWTDKINHPLKLNFIQNRVMLLLEKYITKLFQRIDLQCKKVRQNCNETVRLMQVEALLVKNFAVTPPVINELARVSAMSPTKLKNNFKAVYGLPIYEYFQKNRMLKAKSLLVLGKYTVREVGQMVGYSNQSHFASTFKKKFGFLPSEITTKDSVLVYNSN